MSCLPVSGQTFSHVDTIPSAHAFSLVEYQIQVPLGQTFVKSGGCQSNSTVRFNVPHASNKPHFTVDTVGNVVVPMIAMGSRGTTMQRSVASIRGASTMTVSRTSVTVDDDPGRYLMELKADPTVPTKMVMHLGYGSAWLDLSNMDMRAVDIQSGQADVFLTYKSPNTHPMSYLKLVGGMGAIVIRNVELARSENIVIENGMGNTKVIIGEKPYCKTNTSINVGSGTCTMLIHKDYPVKVIIKTSLFSTVELPEEMIKTCDNTYVNLAYKANPQNAMTAVVEVSMGRFYLVSFE